jgi:hypothetical protein
VFSTIIRAIVNVEFILLKYTITGLVLGVLIQFNLHSRLKSTCSFSTRANPTKRGSKSSMKSVG